MIKIDSVSKNYGDKKALENVSLTIEKGLLFGLLGQNGAGKTTLIRIVTGIIKSDSGYITHNHQPLDSIFYTRLGYLPEERGLYRKMTVNDNLLFLATLRNIPKNIAVGKIQYWLEKLNALDLLKERVNKLSKGMQQKVQLIATLIHDPELIILDEPFSGLDPVNSTLFKNIFRELIEEEKTIILSTHDMNSVDELCDQIALIHQSKLVVTGNPKELSSKQFKGSYLLETLEPIYSIDVACRFKTMPSVSGTFKYQIEMKTDSDSRILLNEINKTHQIVSFQRQLPTMNDLFIHYTK